MNWWLEKLWNSVLDFVDGQPVPVIMEENGPVEYHRPGALNREVRKRNAR